MAKISNTTVYPSIIPTGRDYFVLTDFEDNKQTKTCTMSDLQIFVGGGAQALVRTITSAEILTLHTTPVVLQTCLAGEYIQVISAMYKYNYGTTVYTISGAQMPKLSYAGTTNGGFVMESGILNLAGDYAATLWDQNTANDSEIVFPNPAGGDSLDFRGGGTAFTGGDGTIELSIQYRLVKLT
jgi:hypothetical protein